MSRPDFMNKGKDDQEDENKGRPDFMQKAAKKVEKAADKVSDAAAAAGRPDFMNKAKDKAEEKVEEMAEKARTGRPDFMKKAVDSAEEAAKNVLESVAGDDFIAEYTVVAGDNLSFISKKFYGSPNHWNDIYEANKDVIGDNPNLIRVGQELKIPKIE